MADIKKAHDLLVNHKKRLITNEQLVANTCAIIPDEKLLKTYSNDRGHDMKIKAGIARFSLATFIDKNRVKPAYIGRSMYVKTKTKEKETPPDEKLTEEDLKKKVNEAQKRVSETTYKLRKAKEREKPAKQEDFNEARHQLAEAKEKLEKQQLEELAEEPITIPNYYQVLGVEQKASPDEIKNAHRKLMGKLEKELESADSDEKAKEIEKQMIEVDEGFMVLSSYQSRRDYDQLYFRHLSADESKIEYYLGETPEAAKLPPTPTRIPRSLNPPSSKSKIGVAFVISSSTKKKATDAAIKFKELVDEAGQIAFGAKEVEKAGIANLTPEAFDGKVLTQAAGLWAQGVKSEQLEHQIDKYVATSSGFSEKQIRSLYAPAYLLAAFESYDPTSFQPVINTPQGSVSAQAELKDFAFRAIKSAGSELANNKGVNLAFKAGTKKATEKATEKLAGKTLQAAISASIPGLGTIISKGISALSRKIFGDKNVAAGSAAIAGLGLLLGNPTLIVAGGVGIVASAAAGTIAATAYVVFTTAASAAAAAMSSFLAALGKTFLATMIGGVLLVTFILLIINQSAYMVPYNPDALTPFAEESSYIRIEKVANPNVLENPTGTQTATVNYTITITARQGAISNIQFESNCQVMGGTASYCPPEENITVSYAPLTGDLCHDEFHHCFPSGSTNCTDTVSNPDPGCSAGETCAVTCETPNVTPSPVTTFPPPAPGIITPSVPYVITYSQTFNSSYADSIVTDTFTVTATSTTGEQSTVTGTATVNIGTPPASSCPILNGGVSCGSYTGNETPPVCAHGSNNYWAGAAGDPDCRYQIPVNTGCYGPTYNADTGGGTYAADNVCRNQSGLCDFYGYATDSPSPAGTPVYLPSIYGESLNWTFVRQTPNSGGSWGYSFTYTGTNPSNPPPAGHTYQIFLTHLNQDPSPVTNVPSGTQVGTLFALSGPHVHIELQIDGQPVSPDFLCE